ncbi:MAG: DNA-processing protein DprA [Candidatus Cloacimonetes bacterium]|nr:DNA-processing protein DprA [Candidatus Cloacimonadota bacterium]
MSARIRAWIKLCSAPQIGAGKAIRLVRELGEPQGFIEIDDTPLSEISFITAAALAYLRSKDDPPDWNKTAKIIEHTEVKFCSILDAEYPEMIRNIGDAPPFLFYLGTLHGEDFRRNLAIVGTRKPSLYGKTQCESITRELVKRNFTIISGLAYGIDAVAHKTVLENGGRTLAVMGSSIENIYPQSHRQLAAEIICNGALITEQIPGSKLNPWNFVQRNRIISGLSQGIWVVEGSEKSGALITAKFAREQQRAVFALPGDVTRSTATGPNLLLNQGAIPVQSYQDILKGLGINESAEEPGDSVMAELNEMERRIYQLLLAQEEELEFDKLIVLSGYSVSQLATLLLSLELKGLVRNAAGNKIYPLK